VVKRRDLTVLAAVLEAFGRGLADGFPDVPDLAEATGLPVDDVARYGGQWVRGLHRKL
jgi:hypothetical protein